MAVITMLLTAPRLKLEQAGRRTAQRRRVRHPGDFSHDSLFFTGTKLYFNALVLLASLCDMKDFQVSVPTDEV